MNYLIGVIISILPLALFSQEISSFEIMSIGKKYSNEEVNTAIFHANFCGYYHKTESVFLKLDDETIIKFKSKTELEGMGISLNETCFEEKKFNLNTETWLIKDSVLLCEIKRPNTKSR